MSGGVHAEVNAGDIQRANGLVGADGQLTQLRGQLGGDGRGAEEAGHAGVFIGEGLGEMPVHTGGGGAGVVNLQHGEAVEAVFGVEVRQAAVELGLAAA